jgi:hypothetical protein
MFFKVKILARHSPGNTKESYRNSQSGNLLTWWRFQSCSSYVKWVPCHHGMARPQVADGGDELQIWRAAANILNKQSRTADKGLSSSLGAGREANNSSS